MHNRSRIQQQPVALRQSLWSVTVRVGMWVVRGCTQEYTAVLMYYMYRLGVASMLLASRLLVGLQTARSSVEHAAHQDFGE